MPPRGHVEAPPADMLRFAGELADVAAAVVLRHFRRPAIIETKADGTPVTAADREAEQALRDAIKARYPDHGIRGEEFGEGGAAGAEYLWVLDPIDGTRSFLTGKPVFAILVGLAQRGRPILGVIDQPVTGERWVGAQGMPTTLNGAAVRTRPCPELARAALYTTGPEWYRGPERDAFQRLGREVLMTLYSADAYAFGLLAGGWVDVAVEAGMEPHDFCALVPVVEGAGGVITDWSGAPLDVGKRCNVLAAGDGRAHAQAVAALAGDRRKP